MGKCNVSGFAKEVNFVRRHKQKDPAGYRRLEGLGVTAVCVEDGALDG
jgi:hypothetical protein